MVFRPVTSFLINKAYPWQQLIKFDMNKNLTLSNIKYYS